MTSYGKMWFSIDEKKIDEYQNEYVKDANARVHLFVFNQTFMYATAFLREIDYCITIYETLRPFYVGYNFLY